MKFGKSLARVVDLSDPEWGPFWMNYKFLKKKINDIVSEQGGSREGTRPRNDSNPESLSNSASEVEFFRVLKSEMEKTAEFFASLESVYRMRHQRVLESSRMLQESNQRDGKFDRSSMTRLLAACVKFYKDVLLLENFAIMNYCGFSKILKKHDKLTGFTTREAYLKNVLSKQSFTHFPFVIELLRSVEKLFEESQSKQVAGHDFRIACTNDSLYEHIDSTHIPSSRGFKVNY